MDPLCKKRENRKIACMIVYEPCTTAFIIKH
jgi:hypothetical protein